MEDLTQAINEALKHVPEARHSYFQMKYFIIGKEVTTQSQMWTCLRQLQTCKKTIENAKIQIETLTDKLELLDLKWLKTQMKKVVLEDLEKSIYEREQILKYRHYQRQIQTTKQVITELEETVKYAEQEARFYLKNFQMLQEVQPLKDFDDLEVQKEYWNEKIMQKINLKMLLQQPLDSELVETALALPDDAPVKKQLGKVLFEKGIECGDSQA